MFFFFFFLSFCLLLLLLLAPEPNSEQGGPLTPAYHPWRCSPTRRSSRSSPPSSPRYTLSIVHLFFLPSSSASVFFSRCLFFLLFFFFFFFFAKLWRTRAAAALTCSCRTPQDRLRSGQRHCVVHSLFSLRFPTMIFCWRGAAAHGGGCGWALRALSVRLSMLASHGALLPGCLCCRSALKVTKSVSLISSFFLLRSSPLAAPNSLLPQVSEGSGQVDAGAAVTILRMSKLPDTVLFKVCREREKKERERE